MSKLRPIYRRIAGSFLVIALVVGALTAVAFAKYRQIQVAMSAPPPPEMPVAVSTTTAEEQSYRRSSVVIGTVLALRSVILRNEVTGVVTEVAVKPGDVVNQGDLLVRFDTRLEEAELKSALATKTLAEDALERNKRLKSSGAGSIQLLEEAIADLTRAEAEVERLRVLIDKKTLLAPFDAKVGLFDLHGGQYLAAGSEITELTGLSDFLNIDFAMPQSIASTISVGDVVELLFGNSGERYKTNIIAIDAAANQISRSLMARVRIPAPPQGLRPGDSVKVNVPYGESISAVAVPTTAIRRGPSGTSVFVASSRDGQLRAELRPIVPLGSSGSRTWIADGIQAGETVVTDGSFKVAEGTLLAVGGSA